MLFPTSAVRWTTRWRASDAGEQRFAEALNEQISDASERRHQSGDFHFYILILTILTSYVLAMKRLLRREALEVWFRMNFLFASNIQLFYALFILCLISTPVFFHTVTSRQRCTDSIVYLMKHIPCFGACMTAHRICTDALVTGSDGLHPKTWLYQRNDEECG